MFKIKKNFLLFAGNHYEDDRGYKNFIGRFSSIQKAKKEAMRQEEYYYDFRWADIVDNRIDKVILLGEVQEQYSSCYEKPAIVVWNWIEINR